MEVAQIARRLAEKLKVDFSELDTELGGIDPEAAEAAALAHDLGHPPFGHVAETELNTLTSERDPDGFEGNAQSFRIITRLAAHRPDYQGLNLTRKTLNAVLKYPWYRGEGPPDHAHKFGAYRTESEHFAHARGEDQSKHRSIEAAIMDHADAVAYSVHDLDDFYRAGLIPLELVAEDLESHIKRFKKNGKVAAELIDQHQAALRNLLVIFPRRDRYAGSYRQRGLLRSATAFLINEFVSPVRLKKDEGRIGLDVPDVIRVQMYFLQGLIWQYVIESPKLATQQHGQRRVIRELFEIYLDAIVAPNHRALVPPAFDIQLEQLDKPSQGIEHAPGLTPTRIAVDIVSSFTDAQALILHRRLTGTDIGSVTDLLEG
jgi:dGTPase